MTDVTYAMHQLTAASGASRTCVATGRSTAWSIDAVVSAPKPSAHVATKRFGRNTTLHPRPEEAPL